jgi:hypothetical protein
LIATAYPLTWPELFPRATRRDSGPFKTSLAGALKNVNDSLRLFSTDSRKKLENLVISSNVTLGAHNPADPGVAVWFIWDGMQLCIPADRYSKVEANLQAIHLILEARRVEFRHGSLALVRASFTGLLALPDNSDSAWWVVLEVERTASADEVKLAYQRLRSQHHPDRAPNADMFNKIQSAYEQWCAQQ